MYEDNDNSFDLIGFLSTISIIFTAVIFAVLPAYIYSVISQYAFSAYESIKFPIGFISFFFAFKLFKLYPKTYLTIGIVFTVLTGLAPTLTYLTTHDVTIEQVSLGLCFTIIIWVLGYSVTKTSYSYLRGL